MRTPTTIATVLLAGLLAACGSGAEPGVHVDQDPSAPSIPTSADVVVFRVDTRGGFTSFEHQLGIVPEVSVHGDGRVVVGGPVTAQYPPHALPNLLTGTLPGAEVERLASLAAELDLLAASPDYGRPGVADLPTTTVSIAVDGTHEHSAYALEVGADTPGPTAAQRRARARLTRFVAAVSDAAARVATEPYEAGEVAVLARPVDGSATDPTVRPGRAGWPLADLATIGRPLDVGPGADSPYRCAVLAGSDARVALAAARDATTITRWTSGGGEYLVVWRPLLPDEHDCPAAP